MKKITLLASACALFMAQSVAAQETQEVQYVQDPAQGVLVNPFKSNWFITAEGGVNVYFSKHDAVRDLQDRFAPNAAIYVGKWFTPVFGARVGVDWLKIKGMSEANVMGYLPNEHTTEGYYKQHLMHVGPSFDLMVNLTNWWCGYKPNRVYNASFYVGGGGYFTLAQKLDAKGNADGYHNGHDEILQFHAGLLNTFKVSKHFDINLDLRATALDGIRDFAQFSQENRTYLDVQAYLGLTYNFGNNEWTAPLVPVVAPAENCDALRARLSAADSRIADLEAQLRDCLNRPVATKEVVKEGPLATVFFPIGQYRLTKEDNNVLNAVASVMKADNKNYTLTGWADNYTGTDAINKRLRENRVNGVYNKLVNCGVPASQLTKTTNNGNRYESKEYVALDRCVTIEEK